MDLQHDISYSLNQQWVGKSLEVIVEKKNAGNGEFFCRSKWDAPDIDGCVHLKADVISGSIVNASIIKASAYDLYATIYY